MVFPCSCKYGIFHWVSLHCFCGMIFHNYLKTLQLHSLLKISQTTHSNFYVSLNCYYPELGGFEADLNDQDNGFTASFSIYCWIKNYSDLKKNELNIS